MGCCALLTLSDYQRATEDMTTEVENGGKSDKTGAIIGAVVGTVGCLLAVAVAVFLTRSYLTKHRSKPEKGFVVDRPGSGEIVPFVQQPGASAGVTFRKGGASANNPSLLIRWRDIEHERTDRIGDDSISTTRSGSSQPLLSTTPTSDVEEGVAISGDDSNAEAGPSSRRAVQEEDNEDASIDGLPPLYRESWDQHRRRQDLHSGSSGVRLVEECRRP